MYAPLWLRVVWSPLTATATSPWGPTVSHWARPEPADPDRPDYRPASVPEWHTGHREHRGQRKEALPDGTRMKTRTVYYFVLPVYVVLILIVCLYLEEGIDVSHSWDEVWDERLQAVLQLYGLRSVTESRRQSDHVSLLLLTALSPHIITFHSSE